MSSTKKGVPDRCPKCGELLSQDTSTCPVCGTKKPHIARAIRGQICPNCERLLMEGDKYCRACGTKVDAGPVKMFRPDNQAFACIYGPMPQRRIHECPKCGYVYQTFSMVDNDKCCPVCGAETELKED